MSKRIALISKHYDFVDMSKKYLQLFDELMVVFPSKGLGWDMDIQAECPFDPNNQPEEYAAYEYLFKKELSNALCFDPYGTVGVEPSVSFDVTMLPRHPESPVMRFGFAWCSLYVRKMMGYEDDIISSIYPGTENFESGYDANRDKSSLLLLTLNKFPVPDETISLEDITDFVKSDEAITKRRRLFDWLNTKELFHLNALEFDEKLDTALFEYSTIMRQLSKRQSLGVVKLLMRLPEEFIHGLLQGKPSQMLDPFMEYQELKTTLLEAEISSPGNEIAYILDCRSKFVK